MHSVDMAEGERRYRPQVVVRQAARRQANCPSCCYLRGVCARARRAAVHAALCFHLRPSLHPEVVGGEQVVETASGMLPEEEQRFMALRAAAASSQISDAFRLEVGALAGGRA